MNDVFGLYLVQKDKQIRKGNPSRLLGLFSTEELARAAREAVRAKDSCPIGKLKIFPLGVDEESFNDGFVTVVIGDEDQEGANP